MNTRRKQMARQSMRPRSRPLLAELIKAKGFVLRDLPERGIGKSMMHGLITTNTASAGYKATCSYSLAERIAEVLGCPVDVLFAPVESTPRGQSSGRAA